MIHFDRPCEHTADLKAIRVSLATIQATQEKILMSQQDLDNVTAGINTEIGDLATQDAAILAAQQEFTAALAAAQAANPTLDTSALVTAAGNLLTAAGADDATVAGLTAAAAAPPAAAPPQGTSN